MAYLIGSILVIIALIITGLILRKRVYDEVDRLESWKMDVTHRNIASEISRIKRLNLSGETQEKFESWKEQWEQIVSKDLPDIEEYLFDAEEAADRFRFPSAKKTLHNVNQTMHSIEKNIEDMLEELNQLMDSEETSRKEIEQIEPDLEALRRTLSQNRHQYGVADKEFDSKLDELEGDMQHYHEMIESGDYTEARKLVDELKLKLDDLKAVMEEFPSIYQKCKQDLPQELNELLSGLREMKDGGYRIEHLGFEKEVQYYKDKLDACMDSLKEGDISQGKAVIPEIEERMAEMYQLLEKEAIAKNYVETKIGPYQEALNNMIQTFDVTKEEVETLKQSYYFEDSDMEKYLSLDKSITQLRKQLEETAEAVEEENTSSHSELRLEIEDGFKELDSLEAEHDEFKERIRSLRKDEMEAKETLKDMKNQLYQVNRRLNKSNIPGIPTFIWNKMDEAASKNNHVFNTLEKQPLDMAEVQRALSEARITIDYVIEQTDLILEQAYLTEQVIQYANRYRSQDPALAAKLVEAERLFRSYEYELSLEHAAKAVEEVEPGALKHIEQFQKAAN
ncbi:septation ring formation regulator EzrA [Lentibacillus amyloliquefaciens]|uniref:Septation ring formation regulator EzrA n=1 Tax=Lentibacillus amyloliquefaciens TaxID=1472767 RepID=A0A0U4FKX7_9BACI|nr:septation ring formation regulator EzrA [Lentibacillus amyloliquefaciens]ALX48372.1 selenide, water dikinase [Lentibacillus amyloliquefaciens]